MAHSHDRTLLASLGFADPDKRDRRHTLACQYLCREDVALKLARALGVDAQHENPPGLDPVEFKVSGRPVAWHFDRWRHSLSLHLAEVERPLMKPRSGFLVGFIDVSIYFRETRTTIEHRSSWRPDGTVYQFLPVTTDSIAAILLIEVKVKPCDVGEIARQIALYAEFVERGATFVVATCWRMPPSDRATLRDKGIHTIYLGPPFEAYCRDRDGEAGDEEMVTL